MRRAAPLAVFTTAAFVTTALVSSPQATMAAGDPDVHTALAAATYPPLPTSGPVDTNLPEWGTGAIDIQAYDLTSEFLTGPAGTMQATARISLVARTNLSTIPLDFTGMVVSSTRVDGDVSHFGRRGNKLLISPRRTLRAGQRVTLEISWTGKIPQFKDAGGEACGMIVKPNTYVALNEPNCASSWFPTNDTPSDKAVFRTTTTVPTGWTVVGNGRLIGEKHHLYRSTYTWDSVDPMGAFVMTLAIGKFTMQHSRTRSGVEIINAVGAGVPDDKAKMLDHTGEYITWLEQRNGQYPLVNTGAMITTSEAANYSLETQTRVFLKDDANELTLLHELAHQWWGDAVSPRSWDDLWINEGMATFHEWEWRAEHGDRSFEMSVARVMKQPTDADVWKIAPGHPGAENLFGDAVYVKSATFMTILYKDMGPTKFNQMRRRWVAEHKGGTGSTEQFLALINQVSGKNYGPLLNTWIRSAGKPELPSGWTLPDVPDEPTAVAAAATRD